MNIKRKAIGPMFGKGIGMLLLLLFGSSTMNAGTKLSSMVASPTGAISFSGYVADGVSTILGHQIDATSSSYKGFLASIKPESEEFYVEEVGFIPQQLQYDDAGNLFVYGGKTLAKYSPANELVWVLNEEQLYGYTQIPDEEWKVRVEDLETKPDGSLDLLLTASFRGTADDGIWEVTTNGDDPATFMLNIWATWPITINIHSYFSEVKIYLFGRTENLTLNAVDGTNMTVVTPEDKTFDQMKNEYNPTLKSSGNGFDAVTGFGLSDGHVDIFFDALNFPDSVLYAMNVGADGSLNWIRQVSKQTRDWFSVFFIGAHPSLIKTKSLETFILIPYRDDQYYVGPITLGDGTNINPDPQPEDSLLYVVKLDESGEFVGYDDFLEKVGPIDSLPFDRLEGSTTKQTSGYNGEQLLWDKQDVVVMDASYEVKAVLTDIAEKVLPIAFDEEISVNDPPFYRIADVVGAGTEFLVVLSSGGVQGAEKGILPQFHMYQLFVRYAYDGTLIDVVPLQLPKPLDQVSTDWEFKIVADLDGNYSYIQGDWQVIEDQIDLEEYTVESIGEFIRYLSKNRGPFSGLKTVAGSWRQHWMFGWVSETVQPNWWYSLDVADYIYVPSFSSDLDFLYYQNGESWCWTNYELYPYVYSFAAADWILIGSSKPL